tara:strand:- start:2902 stop:4170 length:1269 start_codon:yes stop_codon:yes gene_type:complete
MKGKSKMYKSIMALLLIMSSIVFPYEDEYEDVFEPQCDMDFDGENDCSLFLSFASTNWKGKDYRGCIDQYKTAIYCGCVKGDEKNLFRYLGRSFIEVGKPDSASWAFNQGLKNNPNDEVLLEYAAWNAGKLNNIQEQLYFIERLLEINPENVRALERMNDTYKKNEMFEEQLRILEVWLNIDSENKKAMSEKKVAYSKLGKDEIEIDKERWNSDKSNIQYGLDYAEGLIEKGDNELAIDVCNELMVYDDSNKRLLKVISNALINSYQESKALQYLEKLGGLDSNNINTLLEIADVCMNIGEFKKGYNWVNKAIALKTSPGKCYFQRAELLVALVEYNIGDEVDFCDRLVYDLAWEDYNTSYNNGYLNAKVYKDQLDDFITTKGDWFLNAEKFEELSPSNDDCYKLKGSDCYKWLERKVYSKR